MGRRAWLVLSVILGASSCGDVLEPGPSIPSAAELTVGGESVPPPLGQPLAPIEGASCIDELRASGMEVRALEPRDAAAEPHDGCGMREGVTIARGPTGVVYRPAIRVSCAFGRVLARIEPLLQEEARRVVGEQVEVARTMGSYGCRTMRVSGRLSQHAFGNAVDVGELWTHQHHASVLRDFRAASQEGEMLRAIGARLRGSGLLERLLDPDYDADHRNHFHVEGPPLAPLP